MLLRLCFSDGWECGTVSSSGWDCHSPSSFVRLNGLVKYVTFSSFCFFFWPLCSSSTMLRSLS